MAILSSDEDSNRGSDQERLHNDDKGKENNAKIETFDL